MITSYIDKVQRGLVSPTLYNPEKLKRLRRLVTILLGGSLGIMFIVLIALYVDEESMKEAMFIPVMAALTMLVLGETIGYTTAYKITICKALAGLEEGHWHCAEDLQLWLGIPLAIGKRIIAGDYDDLLRDELTCKFIGK